MTSAVVQYSLCIEYTIWTQLPVLHREVSVIQRNICTQLCVVGAANSVLIREVSLIKSVLYGEVPLYDETSTDCTHWNYSVLLLPVSQMLLCAGKISVAVECCDRVCTVYRRSSLLEVMPPSPPPSAIGTL